MTAAATNRVDVAHDAIDAMLRHSLPTLVELVDGTRTLADTLTAIDRVTPDGVAVLQVLERSPGATVLYQIVRDRHAELITHDDAVGEITTLYARHALDATSHRDIPAPPLSEKPMSDHEDRRRRPADLSDVNVVTGHIRGMLGEDRSILEALSCHEISISEAVRRMGLCDPDRGRVLEILTAPATRQPFLSIVDGRLRSKIGLDDAVLDLINLVRPTRPDSLG